MVFLFAALHRHRTNCVRLGFSNAILKEASRGTAAIAFLPSQDDLNSAYFELRARIDGIVSQAEQQARREPIGKIGFVLAKRNKFGAADWVRSGKNVC